VEIETVAITEQYVDGLSARWAASGAAGLSGRRDADPLPVPADLVRGVEDCAATIESLTRSLGRTVAVDGLALLGERAALTGFRRSGSTSCGGASRLLRVADGWVALSLARSSDIEVIPALLDVGDLPTDVDELWAVIDVLVRDRRAVELVDRATLLGLPCAAVGESRAGAPIVSARTGATVIDRPMSDLVVVDLSSLWAGPLCADLLGRAGCRVVTVESTSRPDGARHGSTDFYDLLHAGHESVALDFGSERDRAALRALISSADIVIEASRPRALAALGIDRAAAGPSAVWVSITGHGRLGESAHRVAFGDDAAAAGGLVASDDDGPCFCCDAIADPLTGLFATAATLQALADGGRWTVDIAMSRLAGSLAGGPLVPVDPAAVVAPRARPLTGAAPALGAHTDTVLRDVRVRR
jgi:hypothetical protein